MQEIEQGLEAFIPQELSVSHLPYSFRFYDPILAIINSKIDDEYRITMLTRNEVAFNVHSQLDAGFTLTKHLGIPKEKLHA